MGAPGFVFQPRDELRQYAAVKLGALILNLRPEPVLQLSCAVCCPLQVPLLRFKGSH